MGGPFPPSLFRLPFPRLPCGFSTGSTVAPRSADDPSAKRHRCTRIPAASRTVHSRNSTHEPRPGRAPRNRERAA